MRPTNLRRQIHACGITLFGLHYNSEELQALGHLGAIVADVSILLPTADLHEIKVRTSCGSEITLAARSIQSRDQMSEDPL